MRCSGGSSTERQSSGAGGLCAQNLGVTSLFAGAVSAEAITTVQPATSALAGFLGGFVAAEGSFISSGEPSRFRFAVGLGAVDGAMCELFQQFFDAGHLFRSPRRKPHYDDEVTFAVQSLRDLVEVVVPFMDEHLPDSYKRQQYLEWRTMLLGYWEHRARRRRPCAVDGCGEPRRAYGLCRLHVWTLRRQ